jgi:hypothetical protein
MVDYVREMSHWAGINVQAVVLHSADPHIYHAVVPEELVIVELSMELH